jgi:alkylated DNA repair dioxygenase AlkB
MTEQLSLFPAEPDLGQREPDVPGMHYVPSFLTPDEEKDFIRRIDENEGAWLTDLSRRVQHYGWRYDYSERTITADMRIGPLPDWLQMLAQRLYDETGLFERPPEQVIVNEYEPGQGIAMHTDHSGFGSTVAMVSLGDEWQMDFSKSLGDGSETKAHMMLERGSALILTDEARRKWRHGIAKRLTDGAHRERKRKRRVSLTFRTVNQPAEAQ